jgi:two-component system nitrate/nitrite response regulator NarL
MSNHFFLSSPSAQPSARWKEAFPKGMAADLATVLAQAHAVMVMNGGGQTIDADTIWVATTVNYWPQMLGRLGQGLPRCPIVVLSATPSEGEGLLALQSGARGYCNLHSVPDLFKDVAQSVHHGGLWVGPDLMVRLMAATRKALPSSQGPLPATLSAREIEVARAVADGHSNKEVGNLLGITERTVKAHLGAAFEKLAVRDRLQLVLRLSDAASGGQGLPASGKSE